jgi:ribosome-associated protein
MHRWPWQSGAGERPLPSSGGCDILEGLELAEKIAGILSDRKAEDVVVLDIHALASFADFFVLATGTSERQLGALAEALDNELDKDHDTTVAQIEGKPDSGWVLMVYRDVVVHIFSEEMREYYRLDRIWAAAPAVLRLQ